MEAVVDETLRHVLVRDARVVLDVTDVDDALVGDSLPVYSTG